jgi:hypothetical protein
MNYIHLARPESTWRCVLVLCTTGTEDSFHVGPAPRSPQMLEAASIY